MGKPQNPAGETESERWRRLCMTRTSNLIIAINSLGTLGAGCPDDETMRAVFDGTDTQEGIGAALERARKAWQNRASAGKLRVFQLPAPKQAELPHTTTTQNKPAQVGKAK